MGLDTEKGGTTYRGGKIFKLSNEKSPVMLPLTVSRP
jgi:hypothetical protein